MPMHPVVVEMLETAHDAAQSQWEASSENSRGLHRLSPSKQRCLDSNCNTWDLVKCCYMIVFTSLEDAGQKFRIGHLQTKTD